MGMANGLVDKYPQLFKTLDQVTGSSVTKLMQEGPLETLTLTFNAQPAILAVSYAAWIDLIESKRVSISSFSCFVGHSLGELTALCIAGCFSYEDAIMLARNRGLFMQEAVNVGEGGMVAAVGQLDSEVFDLAQANEVYPANLNTLNQVVFAGLNKNLKIFSEQLSAKGKSVKIIPLKVSAPFHTPLLASARERFRQLLETVKIMPPRIAVLSNIDGECYPSDTTSIRDRLAEQIVSPVRFVDCVQNAIKIFGCEQFIEIGYGSVLTGLVTKISSDLAKITV